MIIQLNPQRKPATEQNLLQALQAQNIAVQKVETHCSDYLIATIKEKIDPRFLGGHEAVADVFRITDNFKLVSSQWKINPTAISIGKGVKIGNGHFQVMAGPCSIESEAQVDEVAQHLKRNNIQIMRGGVFKPRSSPYSFKGLGIEGLKMFQSICQPHGIKIISEVMQSDQIDQMYPYVDIFQVGTRNAQNYNLLEALGKTNKPILLKRGFSGTLEELLLAAEYIFANGNENIILCERGIRTFEKSYRNTVDINAIAYLKEKSHLPVVLDPSHGVGVRKLVAPITLAGIMAGADGINMEVHPIPEKAFSDGQQSLHLSDAELLYQKIKTTVLMRDEMKKW